MARTFASKSDLVAEGIRRRIQSGELEPGTSLRQRDLATEFGVSATPVREALQKLEVEGYVVAEPHRGAVVVRWKGRQSESGLIRSRLEPLCAELAASRAGEATLSRLREINGRLSGSRSAETEGDIEREFHLALAESADSPLLVAIVRQLWQNRSTPLGYSAGQRSVQSEHEAILRELENHNPKAAGELMAEHVIATESLSSDPLRPQVIPL